MVLTYSTMDLLWTSVVEGSENRFSTILWFLETVFLLEMLSLRYLMMRSSSVIDSLRHDPLHSIRSIRRIRDRVVS